MKKRSIFISITLVYVISTIILVIMLIKKEQPIVANENNINNSGNLTMMLETDVDSNEYEVSASNKWPQEGYIFNASMSACEKGSEIIWNEETKTVNLKTSISDKCYIYFDKYNIPIVTNIEATNITSNSITINVTAMGGDGEVVSYHYSIDNGEYISSNSNSYTFNNLEAETNYNISVYVTDSNGIKANNYNVNFTTNSGLISFTVSENSTITTYYAEEGMTWLDWVYSDYNTDNFTMPEFGVCVNGYSLMDIYYTDIIENGANYVVSSTLTCAPGKT